MSDDGQPTYQLMPPLAADEFAALKASISSGYDAARPIVVDEAGNVLDGHHRAQVCAELGITPPTVVLPGLTEDEKHDYALRVNLACRHLTQAQKRDLIRGELDRDPKRSDRHIGRLCGVDHKTVGAVRCGEIPHLDAEGDGYLATRARVIRMIDELGFAGDDDVAHQLTQDLLLNEAARGLLRYGVCDTPPAGWKPIRRRGRYPGRSDALAEANRLLEWRTRVEREAGRFLNWCDAAGITLGKAGVRFPEQLRYPQPDDWDGPWPPEELTTAEDQHHAALGHFYGFWCTGDELREMAAAS